MNLYLLFAITGVLGIASLVTVTQIPRWSSWDFPLVIVGIVLVMGSVMGAGITASVEADKSRCLDTLPQVSNRETRWLDGECYMKADDGKFVPQEWIEKGYERD